MQLYSLLNPGRYLDYITYISICLIIPLLDFLGMQTMTLLANSGTQTPTTYTRNAATQCNRHSYFEDEEEMEIVEEESTEDPSFSPLK